MFIGVLVLDKEVNAYEYPTNASFFEYVDESLGQVKVFVPQDKISYLSYEEGEPYILNISSGSIYGYFTYRNTDYRFTFPTYDIPYVRLSNSSTNTYMSVESVVDTNIDFVSESTLSLSNETNYNRNVLYISVIGGVLLFLIWLKR